MIRDGLDLGEIALRTDRPLGSVQTQLSRLGVTRVHLERRVRERIVELGRDGWTLSRISKQCGVSDEVTARELRRAGIEPKAVVSYPSGRYGRDLPLPGPGEIVRLPLPAPKIPPRSAFDDLTVVKKRRWTDEDVAELERRVRAGETIHQCAVALERGVAAVYKRYSDVRRALAGAAPVLAIASVPEVAAAPAPVAPSVVEETAVVEAPAGKYATWTRQDDDRIVAMTEAGRTAAEIAAALGRTEASVYSRRSKAGLGRKARAVDVAPPLPPAVDEAELQEILSNESEVPDPIDEEVPEIAPSVRQRRAAAPPPPGRLSDSLAVEIRNLERRIVEDQQTVAMMRALAARIERGAPAYA